MTVSYTKKGYTMQPVQTAKTRSQLVKSKVAAFTEKIESKH